MPLEKFSVKSVFDPGLKFPVTVASKEIASPTLAEISVPAPTDGFEFPAPQHCDHAHERSDHLVYRVGWDIELAPRIHAHGRVFDRLRSLLVHPVQFVGCDVEKRSEMMARFSLSSVYNSFSSFSRCVVSAPLIEQSCAGIRQRAVERNVI